MIYTSSMINKFQQFKNMPIYQLLFLFLTIKLCSPQQSISEVPSSFAFITVTHTRGNNYRNIQSHIERYATMECQAASEMIIVWNNDIQPQQAPLFSNKHLWKRPVFFYKTPNNSMDWRYKIPIESKAQLFFIIDDDVEIDCQQLQRGLAKWQENAVGSIGPIVTYAVRFFEYTQQKGFAYGRVKERDMFSIGLVGLSFMSRHFMQLYYAKVDIVEEMRAIVRQKNNCDDIGINWLVQYFYPELQTIYIEAVKGNLLANSPAIAQSTNPNHYPYRNHCLRAFTELFGINPLRYKPITDSYHDKEKRIIPLRTETVRAKKKYMDKLIAGQSPEGFSYKMKFFDNGTTLANQLKEKLLQEKSEKNELLQEVKQLRSKLEERNSQSQSPNAQNKRENIQIQLEEGWLQKFAQELLYCVLGLVLVVMWLIYLAIKLSNEKAMLIQKNNQGNVFEESPFISSHLSFDRVSQE